MALRRVTPRQVLLASGLLALALLATMAGAVLVGSDLTVGEVFSAVRGRGAEVAVARATVYDIVVRLRLPRVLLAALTGCALAAAGGA